MNKILVLFFCFFMGFQSCNYLKNVNALASGKLKRKNFVDQVPFELKKDLIVIKARLNSDTVAREFIFDTGAFDCKVEAGLADQLGLRTVATKTNSTAQGISQQIEITRINSIQIGSTEFSDISAGKLNYSSQSASPCIARDGIIGANLMKLAHWQIDYEKEMIYFSDQPFEVPSQDTFHKASFKKPLLSGVPSISLHVGGQKIEDVLLDVGYNGGLVLPIRYTSYFPTMDEHVILDQSTSGIFGASQDSLIVKNLKVEIDGFVTEIPVEFSSLNKALLGNEFLKHFKIQIDYRSKDIVLFPKREVEIVEPKKFLVGIVDSTHWLVNRTNPKLPLALGDTLIKVNQKQPKDVFNSFCDYVLNNAVVHSKTNFVVEKKNGEVLSFSVEE